ncbi:hypothetical protein [Clostridium tagluense]|uniref:Uncharacterized protein n=1 Tax=Clostridium tagluense TaxID=360422 RepID=A0A401USW6_9CLOT|nr:hypothetical protein [Clostridium tagluense]GCD12643.1 hypothetical protein Ctaglu_42660 [Clostridium tagluense]
MNKNKLESLENLKSYEKEVVLIGLYQYQIRAIVDFGKNKIMYRVGDSKKTNLTDNLDKAIELITEMVEKDDSCN